jgi:hypothetical protein
MDMLPLQPVIVIQPVGVNQGGAGLAVLRDDLFPVFPVHLLAQFSELRPSLREGNNVFGGNGHGNLLGDSIGIINNVQNSVNTNL